MSFGLIEDPCQTRSNRSRCTNTGICKPRPDIIDRDEKFECECPHPFYGKYCERWGE